MGPRVVLYKAAGVPPAAAGVFPSPRWLPLPGPVKCYGRATSGCEVADQLNVGVLVEVWIGVEFPGDKRLDLAQCGGMDVCEATDLGIDGRAVRTGAQGGCLAYVEFEGEHELVIVAQFENEVWGARYRLGVLFLRMACQYARLFCGQGGAATDLYEFDGARVALLSRGCYSRGREAIW